VNQLGSAGARRLGVLAAGLIVVALGVLPSPAYGLGRPIVPAFTEAAAEQLGDQAYEYGIPLMEFVRQARQQTSVTVPNSTSDAPVNQLGSARQMATASNQVIVQPNNDTLYTMGHLDLTNTALVLHVPAIANHRYYSFELLDPYTNVFHYVGTRTTGDGAGNFLITGPKFNGHVPAGVSGSARPTNMSGWSASGPACIPPRRTSRARSPQRRQRLPAPLPGRATAARPILLVADDV
jgi:hypothetical protein